MNTITRNHVVQIRRWRFEKKWIEVDFKTLEQGVDHMDVFMALVEDLEPAAVDAAAGMIRVQGNVKLNYARLKTKPRPRMENARTVRALQATGAQVFGRTSEASL